MSLREHASILQSFLSVYNMLGRKSGFNVRQLHCSLFTRPSKHGSLVLSVFELAGDSRASACEVNFFQVFNFLMRCLNKKKKRSGFRPHPLGLPLKPRSVEDHTSRAVQHSPNAFWGRDVLGSRKVLYVACQVCRRRRCTFHS